MKNYTVMVYGVMAKEVEADSAEHAEELVYGEILEDGIDVELMNIQLEAEENDD